MVLGITFGEENGLEKGLEASHLHESTGGLEPGTGTDERPMGASQWSAAHTLQMALKHPPGA